MILDLGTLDRETLDAWHEAEIGWDSPPPKKIRILAHCHRCVSCISIQVFRYMHAYKTHTYTYMRPCLYASMHAYMCIGRDVDDARYWCMCSAHSHHHLPVSVSWAQSTRSSILRSRSSVLHVVYPTFVVLGPTRVRSGHRHGGTRC